MTDILDGGLREQLADALLCWGGEDGGCQTPTPTAKTEPTTTIAQKSSRVPVRSSMVVDVDEGHKEAVNDDIDADSIMTRAESVLGRSDSRQQCYTPVPPLSVAQKALPPVPDEAVLASPEPEMSCRISRFPISHPCEVPELMPDDDAFGATATPSVSGPATPCVATEVFRPLTQLMSFDLDLGPPQALAASPEPNHRPRKTSITSAQSEASASDGLGIIREEEDDPKGDSGRPRTTPTEVSSLSSYGNDSGAGPAQQQRFLTAGKHSHTPSISSLGSATASVSSSDWRTGNVGAARRSVHLFSRLRGAGRPSAEEECLEKRSLTPVELSTPPRVPGPGHPGDPSPSSPSSSINPLEPSGAASRFFARLPWIGDTEPKGPKAVFGVDLKDSIRAAPMKIRISHRGRSTSYRTFPLSVYKCCEFIRRSGGGDANLFASPGNAFNVSSLKEIFSQHPRYGDGFEFAGSEYTVYDAARLILIFLEELPKPLIPQSVVRSWVLLARQAGAIEPPCPRVETGLDFWAEALNRLPTANRNLTKQLLTLFAEVLHAASGAVTEADARQLASTVARAMFHQDTDAGVLAGNNQNPSSSGREQQKRRHSKKSVHPILALAFLIKKRGEYVVALGKAAESRSRRDSKMFLPSTKEILEWKNGQ